MRIPIVAAGLALATIVSVHAEPLGAPERDPHEVICIRPSPPTGSFMMPKPECHTRAEWTAIRQAKDNRFVHGSVDIDLAPNRNINMPGG